MDIRPMLATPTTAASGRRSVSYEDLIETGQWIGDVKLDGVRALAHWDGKMVTLANRNGVKVDHRYPEVVTVLTEALAGRRPLVLDGEIVAEDGRFETTLLRDKQENAFRIRRMVESHPVLYVAFDLPSMFADWQSRRGELDLIAEDWRDNGSSGLSTTVTSRDPAFLSQVKALGMEGVIAKHVASRYEPGKRSRMWLKFKNLHRVSCLVAGYTLGSGSRAHFGAMKLAMLDGHGDPVPVGRVGTGFTEREIASLKKAIDRGDLLILEIEALGVTSSGQLRQPVYVGVRNDLRPSDCVVSQLSALPRA